MSTRLEIPCGAFRPHLPVANGSFGGKWFCTAKAAAHPMAAWPQIELRPKSGAVRLGLVLDRRHISATIAGPARRNQEIQKGQSGAGSFLAEATNHSAMIRHALRQCEPWRNYPPMNRASSESKVARTELCRVTYPGQQVRLLRLQQNDAAEYVQQIDKVGRISSQPALGLNGIKWRRRALVAD